MTTVGGYIYLTTQNRFDAGSRSGVMKFFDAVHIAMVGKGQSGHAVILGFFYQIFDGSGTVENRIKTVYMKMCKRHNYVDIKRVIFEAPQKSQQVAFILKFGSSVNLANIAFDEVISLETLRRGLRGDTFGKI